MHFPDGIKNWLLIEQSEYATQWGAPTHSHGLQITPDAIHSLALERQDDGAQPRATMHLLGRSSGAAPRQRTTENRPKVIVLFLEHGKAPRDLDGLLPDTLLDDIRDDGRTWQVWCHYGGNIELAGNNNPTMRWAMWNLLDEESKSVILKANRNICPTPFSQAQRTLPWHDEISRAKDTVSSDIEWRTGADISRMASTPFSSDDGGSGNWTRLQEALSTAWLKASEQALNHATIWTLSQTLPVVILAQYLLAVMGHCRGMPALALAQKLVGGKNQNGLCVSLGLGEHFYAFEHYPDIAACKQLRRYYSDLLHSLNNIAQLSGKWTDERGIGPDEALRYCREQEQPLRSELKALKGYINAFKNGHAALSEAADKAMRPSP